MKDKIFKEIEQILMKNDNQSRELINFIESVATDESGALCLDALEFYLKYKDRRDIMNKLRSSFSINDWSEFIFIYSHLSKYIDTNKSFDSYFNLLSDEHKKAKCFFNEIKQTFPIDKDILEIGSGRFPSVAKYIDLIQQKTKGSITCYDSAIKLYKSGNIILKREDIKMDTNISRYDYIYSFRSCSATDTVLQLAQSQHKEFILGLCGCPKEVPTDFAEIINNQSHKFLSDYLEYLALSDKQFIQLVLKLPQKRINFPHHKLSSEMYAMYLLAKLKKQNIEQAEYSLKMQESIPPIIIKKYYKKYY